MSKHHRHSEQGIDGPNDGAPPAPAPASEDQPQAEHIELSPEGAELVRQIQAERDEAIDGRLRALADFRNYQRRALENEQRAMQSGSSRLVRAILPALDHLDLALSQNPDQMNVAQLLEAIRIVRDEFSKALNTQGVERIEPSPGEAFDPHRHEAVMRQPLANAPPNSVVSSFQAGYGMGDTIIRPAKVSVALSDDGH